MTDDHNHSYEFRNAPNGTVIMCSSGDCTEMRVATDGAWRELTITERTDATIIMWEDVIITQAMQAIHGQERGLTLARQRLGYTTTTEENPK